MTRAPHFCFRSFYYNWSIINSTNSCDRQWTGCLLFIVLSFCSIISDDMTSQSIPRVTQSSWSQFKCGFPQFCRKREETSFRFDNRVWIQRSIHRADIPSFVSLRLNKFQCFRASEQPRCVYVYMCMCVCIPNVCEIFLQYFISFALKTIRKRPRKSWIVTERK